MPDCCAVCGTNHCPDADETYRAVVVASEPITTEAWTEVSEGTVLVVDEGGTVTAVDLLAQAA